MRKVIYALIAFMLLANQAVAAQAPAAAPALKQSPKTGEKTNVTLTLNTKSSNAIEVTDLRPDFDTEVLTPLRAKQAERVEQARVLALARSTAKRRVVVSQAAAVRIATGDVWEALRNCEAGGDYSKNTGNGYYGAYQYSNSTWGNYMGFARADLAPADVQDARARATQAARGWKPWPACARKLGLL